MQAQDGFGRRRFCPFNEGMDRLPPSAVLTIGLLCVAGIATGASLAGMKDAALGEARSKAAACLARDFDGRSFRDPYLAYIYPEEKLPGTASDPDLTYRRIDADIMLSLLQREGGAPAPLQGAVEQAGKVLRELPASWNGRGFSNVRREPRAGGIALDTFCIVGWLEQDRGMADAVARALDGDGWLPEGLYEGDERFRRDADEAWCVKLLASPAGSGMEPARRVLERLVDDFRRARSEDAAGRQTFYAAYHLGLLLEDWAPRSTTPGYAKEGDVAGGAPSRTPSCAIQPADLRTRLLAALEGWAAARPAGKEEGADILEWANLATVRLEGLDRTGLPRRAVEMLLRSQREDGCWRVPGARPPEAGSSFLTLRALLALRGYREP